MELLSGAEMVVRSLRDEGVKFIYGYPGGALLHVYDAIFRQDDVTHVLVRHEQAAAHMADGYARATGKPGVVLVTSGPGATNTITGIATAYMDSIPMVVISGQVASHMVGTDAFQETDMVGISRPIVKHSFIVKDPREIPEIVKKAFYLAQTGRPGPVVIDIPKDMTNPAEKFEYSYPKKVKLRSYNPAVRGHSGQIRKALDLLVEARRPIIYSGGGVIMGGAARQLTDLGKELGVPVTNTLMGLGGFPGTDRQFLGMLGMHGSYTANVAMHHADVVMCVGARFDDRVINGATKFCPNAKIIHIDIDPASISKTIKADIPIVGPVDSVLTEMLAMTREHKLKPKAEVLAAWWKQIDEWRGDGKLFPYDMGDGSIIKPQTVIETLWEVTKGDAYVTSDVGQHQMFASQYYPFDKPNRWINSGGLGTMGYAVPAAMGAKAAAPEKEVWAIDGDGCFQMTNQELTTSAIENFPIKVALINNGNLGMVRQWQTLFYEQRYSNTKLRPEDNSYVPDFVRLSEGLGCVAIRVTKEEEVIPAIEKAREINDRPVVIDFIVGEDAQVWPMVAAGKSNDEIESARGLRPLFDEEMSAGESPADIHETIVDNAEDAAKAPDANHPTTQTR